MERSTVYGTPSDAICSDEETILICHGNFLPIDRSGKRVYIGNIFNMPTSVLEKKLKELTFESVRRDGMAIYALKTIASLKPGDIVITKVGNNTIEVYRVREYRLYKAITPPEKFLKEHEFKKRGEVFTITYEQYCIEVEKLGTITLSKDLYKRIAIPRTITRFKDQRIVSEIMNKIQDLLASNL